MTRLDLAGVLDKIAANGISEFYNGNLTQEMTSVVRLNLSTLTTGTHSFTFQLEIKCVYFVFASN